MPRLGSNLLRFIMEALNENKYPNLYWIYPLGLRQFCLEHVRYSEEARESFQVYKDYYVLTNRTSNLELPTRSKMKTRLDNALNPTDRRRNSTSSSASMSPASSSPDEQLGSSPIYSTEEEFKDDEQNTGTVVAEQKNNIYINPASCMQVVPESVYLTEDYIANLELVKMFDDFDTPPINETDGDHNYCSGSVNELDSLNLKTENFENLQSLFTAQSLDNTNYQNNLVVENKNEGYGDIKDQPNFITENAPGTSAGIVDQLSSVVENTLKNTDNVDLDIQSNTFIGNSATNDMGYNACQNLSPEIIEKIVQTGLALQLFNGTATLKVENIDGKFRCIYQADMENLMEDPTYIHLCKVFFSKSA